jgi:prepilin-type N-terminal cleavage/methylation domain-containing protein
MSAELVRGSAWRARFRAAQRGFTMVELMVVVVIVSVLAVVGITLLRAHIYKSKAAEATAMIQSIRAAQERWRSETTTYLDVSSSTTAWYPMATPGRTKYHWVQSDGNDYDRWQLLAPTAPGLVQCGYTVVAGPPGQQPPVLDFSNPPSWTTVPSYHWYLIQAMADTDEDGVQARYAASSFTGEVAMEHEGE